MLRDKRYWWAKAGQGAVMMISKKRGYVSTSIKKVYTGSKWHVCDVCCEIFIKEKANRTSYFFGRDGDGQGARDRGSD